MLNLFKKLFNKSEGPPTTKTVQTPEPIEPALPIPGVETAALSLAAIIDRFPEALKQNVACIPGGETTVVLPLSTIVKQLPGGSVKMSLASIYRQAPEGTFKSTRLEEKHMVEIPLAEIFKRVRPELLKRRDDQRSSELADTGVDIFGDKANPYAISPTVLVDHKSEMLDEPHVAAARDPQSPPEHRLRMSEPMIPAPPPGIISAPSPANLEPLRMSTSEVQASSGVQPPSVAAAAAAVDLASVKAAEAHANQPPLKLLLADLAVCWPDHVRSEIATLNGVTVALPSGDVAAGLARGKVMFTWCQLRAWMNPEPGMLEQIDPALELSLPLRVVAPAFLQSQKETTHRRKLSIDETIPELFVPSSPAAFEEPSQTLSSTDAAEESPRPATAGPLRMQAASRSVDVQLESRAQIPHQAPSDPRPPHNAASIATPSAPERRSPALTMAQLFAKPDKSEWSPAEIVQHIIKLPQVAGAVVALQEGLVVAHDLPEPMRGEVIAAFLPQMYARVNQYADEMKLGQIDEVLLTSNGAQLQLFRLGYVFFAVLGEAGATLPPREMRLIADELARQTDK